MNFKTVFGVIELILGAYLLNGFFKWLAIPTSFAVIDKWIYLISAIILLIFGLLTLFKKTAILSGY